MFSQRRNQIEAFRKLQLGYLPVIGLTIRQPINESGEFVQSITLELARTELSASVTLLFSGTRDLRLVDFRPGIRCLLEITDETSAQLEGIRFRVHNAEQDLTLSFYCSDFSVVEIGS
jgi:hypothetical protein